MRCSEFQEQITAWLDRETAGTLSREMRDHSLGCHACNILLTREQQSRAWILENQAVLEVSPRIWTGIQAKLQPAGEAHKPGWRERIRHAVASGNWLLQPRLLAGSALTALILISALVLNPLRSPSISDQDIRKAMEQYIEWRESQGSLYRPDPRRPYSGSGIQEMKSSNPFLEEILGSEERNPFRS